MLKNSTLRPFFQGPGDPQGHTLQPWYEATHESQQTAEDQSHCHDEGRLQTNLCQVAHVEHVERQKCWQNLRYFFEHRTPRSICLSKKVRKGLLLASRSCTNSNFEFKVLNSQAAQLQWNRPVSCDISGAVTLEIKLANENCWLIWLCEKGKKLDMNHCHGKVFGATFGMCFFFGFVPHFGRQLGFESHQVLSTSPGVCSSSLEAGVPLSDLECQVVAGTSGLQNDQNN